MGARHAHEAPACAFCGKSEGQGVGKGVRLIAGPGVYICSECVSLCVEILDDEKESEQSERH